LTVAGGASTTGAVVVGFGGNVNVAIGAVSVRGGASDAASEFMIQKGKLVM